MDKGDTGTSSKTLWEALTGQKVWGNRPDIPYDPADFARCYNLMFLATDEQKKAALEKVVKICPRWLPFARDWDELEALYLAERTMGSAPDLYEKMQKLRAEADKIVGA
jgi:hypothetical protein